MSVEQSKALVRRWVEAWNTNTNLAVIDQIFAADWIDRNPIPGDAGGIEGARHFVQVYRTAFPDVQLTIDLLMAEGDMVMFRWIANATHLGPLGSIAPTGKRVSFSGITVHRVANGKFVETVTEIDSLGLIQQLGVVPASG